jgi:cell wall-associated NlpC family hydrolase
MGGDNRKQDGGLDCSGLVQYSYGQAGIKIGRSTWQQVTEGRHVPIAAIRPGDALYFDMNGGPRDANHTGIYIGNGQMIVAPKPGDRIQIQTVGDYWKSRVVDIRRFSN